MQGCIMHPAMAGLVICYGYTKNEYMDARRAPCGRWAAHRRRVGRPSPPAVGGASALVQRQRPLGDLRAPGGCGGHDLGRAGPRIPRVVDTSPLGSGMTDLHTWRTRKTDQDSCYLILRLQGCRLHWWSEEADGWSPDYTQAACWADREEAYQIARRLGGLLHLYTRSEGLLTGIH